MERNKGDGDDNDDDDDDGNDDNNERRTDGQLTKQASQTASVLASKVKVSEAVQTRR